MSDARLYPARPILAASAAVLRDGRVLVAARAVPPLAHLFSCPGGLVEPGETLADAARRELREEVGVEAAILGPLPPVEVIERDDDGRVRRHFIVVPHAARWLSGEAVTGPEALEVRWLAPDEIGSVPTTPDLEAVLRAAFAWDGRATVPRHP